MAAKVQGTTKLLKQLAGMELRVPKYLKTALLASAKQLQAGIRRGLKNKKSGKTYRTKKQWETAEKTYRASRAYQAPASPTEHLVNAVVIRAAEDGQSVRVGVLGKGIAPLAKSLEFGTLHLATRPFVLPVFRRQRERIKKRLHSAVQKALKVNGAQAA